MGGQRVVVVVGVVVVSYEAGPLTLYSALL